MSPAKSRRLRRQTEAGMVTVEMALGLAALAVVLALALGLMQAAREYLGVQDTARTVAVELARGENESVAILRARGDADIEVHRSADLLTVTAVRRASGPAGALGLNLSASASVLREPGE